jgi:hypothetical protein
VIIGLLSLPNEFLYGQFNPVAYMVKLNIEMTMASLIKRIALTSVKEQQDARKGQFTSQDLSLDNGTHTSASAKARNSFVATVPKKDEDRIHTMTEVHVRVEEVREDDREKDGFGDVGDRYGFERRL